MCGIVLVNNCFYLLLIMHGMHACRHVVRQDKRSLLPVALAFCRCYHIHNKRGWEAKAALLDFVSTGAAESAHCPSFLLPLQR